MRNLISYIQIIVVSLWITACVRNDAITGIPAESERLTEYANALRLYKTPAGDFYAEIVNTNDSSAIIGRYLLVDKDNPIPKHSSDIIVITTPVNSLILYSSVHASALEELNAAEIISGVADPQYFTNKSILNGIKNGTIASIGNSASPSIEKIVDIDADAILLSYYSGMPDISNIKATGVPVVMMAENTEISPLARAEWIKFLGVLTGKYTLADSIFKAVQDEYTILASQATVREKKNPKTIMDTMYQGIWYVSGGKSYHARLLRDAGANYPWISDNTTGSLNLSFEEVYEKGYDADIWIIRCFGNGNILRQQLESDSRYKNFSPYRNGMIFFSDTSVSSLFDDGAFHPDKILREYIRIFHPEIESTPLQYFQPYIPK